VTLAPAFLQIGFEVQQRDSNRSAAGPDPMAGELAGFHQLVDQGRTHAESRGNLSHREHSWLVIAVFHGD
jgi:hypothetical protein